MKMWLIYKPHDIIYNTRFTNNGFQIEVVFLSSCNYEILLEGGHREYDKMGLYVHRR